MKRLRERVNKLAIILLIFGLLLGFYVGTYVTIRTVASIASGFVDKEIVEQAIYQYEHHIKKCYPIQNGT